MKWNDIRDRLKKSSNSVMESLQSTTPLSNGVTSVSVTVNDSKKPLVKRVLFPVLVAVVIIAGIIVVYFVFKNKTIMVDESFKLDRAEVSAVNNFFNENPPQPLTNSDLQQVQNILNPQPESSVEKTPATKPAVKK